jgi:hypothetical protein
VSKPVDRSTVESFYTAIASRDPDRIAPFLADDVEWLLRGPVDVFPLGIIYMTPLTRAGESSTLASSRTDLSQ